MGVTQAPLTWNFTDDLGNAIEGDQDFDICRSGSRGGDASGRTAKRLIGAFSLRPAR